MAAVESNGVLDRSDRFDDPFTDTYHHDEQPYLHRFTSRFELDQSPIGATSSPSQVKRALEAHLLETERRLQDTQKLGTSLLQQQSELTDKLREVEQQQHEAEISPELRQRLTDLGKEHNDVSREIARSLLGPKSRAISGEQSDAVESGTFTSQATGSPTKIQAPSRRQRNQPTNRAGDLQFAADISTSLLAQVRQLQSAVAERDETIKSANAERLKLEQDVQGFTQRLRTLDENEQRYKDENWNLETQNHELLAVQREANDKEKRLNTSLAATTTERSRLQGDIEELRLAHGKLTEQHSAAQKAHETELHSLKRDFDSADTERSSLQSRIDELTSQNQELARAMAARFRNQSPQRLSDLAQDDNDYEKDLETPEHSPPPSPTKATPRHGGLESDTLKSSLHHAHRMIQNLKSNIHREKTEKIELKRMLQDARDELEQRRPDSGPGNGNKKLKTKPDASKKPIRSDMLGSNRRARTDVEMMDEDWEDQGIDHASQTHRPGMVRELTGLTDTSEAYQTAHESESAFETADERDHATESAFDTADERHATESEAFMTGAESLAGDSTDELTETEGTAPRSIRGQRVVSVVKIPRQNLSSKQAGDRGSYYSTASISGDDDELDTQTPIQPQSNRFRVRNGRQSLARQAGPSFENTPDSVRTANMQDSPATVMVDRSPPAAEQSLFAELGGLDDTSSDRFGTPARSSIFTRDSTPGVVDTPSKQAYVEDVPPVPRLPMIDSGMMTEPWRPDPVSAPTTADAATAVTPTKTLLPVMIDTATQPTSPIMSAPRMADAATTITPVKATPPVWDDTPSLTPGKTIHDIVTETARAPSPSEFPQPPSISTSPSDARKIDNSARQTPVRAMDESPLRNTTFITPPKTAWDEAAESEMGSPDRSANLSTSRPVLAYSEMLAQNTVPITPQKAYIEPPSKFTYSNILSQHSEPIVPHAPTVTNQIVTQNMPVDESKTVQPQTDKKASESVAGAGLLATAAASLGLTKTKSPEEAHSTIPQDVTSRSAQAHTDAGQNALQDASGDAVSPNPRSALKDDDLREGAPVSYIGSDQGCQTLLTAEQIESALRPKVVSPVTPVIATTVHPTSDTAKSAVMSRDSSEPPATVLPSVPGSPPGRPASASSTRASMIAQQHPPLPYDYKTNIARANSMVLPVGPPKKEPAAVNVPIVMGPPTIPASQMRRPKTPAESTRVPTRDNATPRIIRENRENRSTRGGASSSRRSSVSSFASEIDERFNIRTDQGPTANGFEAAPGTDPRMIQAITQTMIGEYLWKYTRKTVSKEMSNTRHRRYFWVHPYTKTLYWSSQDPQSAGAKELSTKSVAIESVRVVSDENPMPPGLHGKSLEITTPGRKIKFTAATAQRHETWFNALSYLLLRGDTRPDEHGTYTTGGNEITREDIDEFNANSNNPHLIASAGRLSMSSYNSRTTQGTRNRTSGPRQSLPANVATVNNGTIRGPSAGMRTSSIPPSPDNRHSRSELPAHADRDAPSRATSTSRMSRVIGSVTGRKTPAEAGVMQSSSRPVSRQQKATSSHLHNESESIYNASVVSDSRRDSAEETRQEMLRQEEAGLENVRACCDGKHDVSTLTHSHRHSDRSGRLSNVSDRINRSMSRRV